MQFIAGRLCDGDKPTKTLGSLACSSVRPRVLADRPLPKLPSIFLCLLELGLVERHKRSCQPLGSSQMRGDASREERDQLGPFTPYGPLGGPPL
jgi:hypothetical protein